MDKVPKKNKMISKKINILRKKFKKFDIDGYAIPKNDEFFSEYAVKDRLKIISNFNGSAGLAIILKKKNYLFVDGRYTIQAQKQSGRQFKIIEIHKFLPHNIIKKLTLGFDPNLFTKKQLIKYFGNSLRLKPVYKNLIDEIYQFKTPKSKPFYSLDSRVIGQNHMSKINKISKILKKNRDSLTQISQWIRR